MSSRPTRARRTAALTIAAGLFWGLLIQVPADAASTVLYLAGDGVPIASLTASSPTAAELPNYDPGRDDQPGLLLQPTLLAGLLETDPAKYQKWAAAKGSVDIDGSVSMTLWSASADFGTDTGGTIRAGLFDCQLPESNCRLIASTVHSVDPWSPSGDWTEHTIAWAGLDYAVPAGHHLVAKVVVGSTSETPLMFAYGTTAYPARIQLSVSDPDQPPVAVNDSAATNEDTSVIIDLLGNDSDPDGDPISVAAVDQGSNGSVVDNGDGSVTYTPDPDWNGEDSFSYTITDGDDTASAVVAVAVAPVNDAPIAIDATFETPEDTSVVVDLLDLASDVDADPLTVESVEVPSVGTVTDNADGTVTYSPPADFSGLATFSYTVSDGVDAGTGTVSVDVGPVNDPPRPAADSVSVPEDGVVTFDVLANDWDGDGDALVLAGLGEPANGTVTDLGEGLVEYTPDPDWFGTDTFTYTASDGSLTADAVVEIAVAPINDSPTAVGLEVSMAEDTTVELDLLAQATDVDGDELSLISVTQPKNASVTVASDGSISITPDADWFGSTEFTFTVGDGLDNNMAKVGVVVDPINDAPSAGADAAATAEDSSVVIDVLANDFDVEGDTISISGVVTGGIGNAVVEGNAIRYDPPTDWHGVDRFSYSVTDGSATTVAAVEVTVAPVNDRPTAVDDEESTDEDRIATFNVLRNDVDVDGDDLSLVSIGSPQLGSASVVAGRIRYAPIEDANGVDTFTYTLRDPSGATSTARVTVLVRAVNDDPVAGNDLAATDEDAAVRVDVLANDLDVDGDALDVSVVSASVEGSAVVNGDGSITFMPEPNWYGDVEIDYQVSDGVATDSARLFIFVRSVNDTPVAHPDFVGVLEEGRVSIFPAGNDTDVDGDTLVVSAWTSPDHGSIEDGGQGLTYMPDRDYFGPDSFSYTVTDGNGGFAASVVSVRVEPVDDVLSLGDDEASTPSGESITIRVLENDVDVDGDLLEIVAFTQGAFGTVTANDDASFTYTPGPDFVGDDTFTYAVTDGTTTQTAHVTLTREIDGVALVETSLTPSSPALGTKWAPTPSATVVIAVEIRDTLAQLAIPAAVAAAGVGGAMLVQSQTLTQLALRVSRTVLRRF